MQLVDLEGQRESDHTLEFSIKKHYKNQHNYPKYYVYLDSPLNSSQLMF